MAKKKSKTQKLKQNIKRKAKEQTKKTVQKEQTKNTQATKKTTQVVPKEEVKYNVLLTEPQKYKKKKDNKNTKQEQKNVPASKKELPKKGKVVKNTDVIYNVALTNKKTEKKKTENKKPVNQKNIKAKKKFNFKEWFSNLFKKKEKKEPSRDLDALFGVKRDKKKQVYSKEYVVKKETGRDGRLKQTNYSIQPKKPKNVFLRLLYEIWTNLNIVFNAILILTFVLFVIGVIKIEIFEKNTIIYICGLILFLMVIAISYNKHVEGWIFTILLCAGMGYAIYEMQYTYGYISALNTKEFEEKTYYVVTFDNPTNKTLYNVSNKKVGILKDTNVYVERYLNTKIKTNYVEYENDGTMFDDFYAQRLRAVIVRDNEYKYLENNVENNRSVKILYEFTVNGRK
jgi:hypothetical protein